MINSDGALSILRYFQEENRGPCDTFIYATADYFVPSLSLPAASKLNDISYTLYEFLSLLSQIAKIELTDMTSTCGSRLQTDNFC